MIPARRVFDEHAKEYDRWFDDHGDLYGAQVRLLRIALPLTGRGLEIGAGSGRFATPLCIGDGIDPSRPLLAIAKTRGVEVVQGEGEHLPYRTGTFDRVLMMTVIGFLPDPVAVLKETRRVLAQRGTLVAGFFGKKGEATRHRGGKAGGRFLRYVRFRTADEVAGFLKEAGYTRISVRTGSGGFQIAAASWSGR